MSSDPHAPVLTLDQQTLARAAEWSDGRHDSPEVAEARKRVALAWNRDRDRMIAASQRERSWRPTPSGLLGTAKARVAEKRAEDRKRLAALIWQIAETPDAKLNADDAEFLLAQVNLYALDPVVLDQHVKAVADVKLARISVRGAEDALAALGGETPESITAELFAIDGEIISAIRPLIEKKRAAEKRLAENIAARRRVPDSKAWEVQLRTEFPLIFPDALRSEPSEIARRSASLVRADH